MSQDHIASNHYHHPIDQSMSFDDYTTSEYHTCNIGVSERECALLNRRFLSRVIDSMRLARLLKKSTIGWPFKADAKNCSTVMDQVGSAVEGLDVVGLPFRSGDWKQ